MKKILCIFLTAIILLLTACNTAKPIDIPEVVESSSERISETESVKVESPSESSSEPIEESIPESKKPEDKGDTTEAPKESTLNGDNWDSILFWTKDYNEYLKFLDNNKDSIPTDFITYDMIKDLGTFYYFNAVSFNKYSYDFIDKNGIILTIDVTPLTNQVSIENVIIPNNINNLRNISLSYNEKNSVFTCDNISYSFFEDGKLYKIAWTLGEKELLLGIHYGYICLADYPLDGETTFVSQLLSTQTATAAVEAFNQKVEAEIAKNIADKQSKG